MTTPLEDKDAIRELLHHYCFCMDEGRFAELAALFAPDGEWIAPYRTATGPADIAAWLQQSVPPQPRRMHYVMNSIITIDGGACHGAIELPGDGRGPETAPSRQCAAPTTTAW